MFRNVQLPNTSKNLKQGCANQQFAIVTVIIIIIVIIINLSVYKEEND